MLNAINGLSDIGFVLFVLAVLCSLVQISLLIALATHVHHIKVTWGLIAVALWVALWFVR